VNARNVLVTGGAGYVGAHACKALAKSGYLPVVYDNLSTGHKSFVRWGPFFNADIRDHATLREVMLSHNISGVLHFAACAYVGESVINPQKYYDNNVTGTLSLLRAMLANNTSTLVFSSSCAIYGEPNQIPIAESAAKRPVNPYGASKLMIEQVLSDYQRAYGLRSVALRYFNAAGADPEGDIGELRDPETHLIPRAMMSIQGYLSDFEVFGSDFPTPDGTAIRDYIHVADLADAHVAALPDHLVEAALAAGEGGTAKVYRIDIPGKEETVFGVALKGVNADDCSGDEFVMSRIDKASPRSTAHLPYEIVVSDGTAYALFARFRIAINWPHLPMVASSTGGTFFSIMCSPNAIEEALTQAAGGSL